MQRRTGLRKFVRSLIATAAILGGTGCTGSVETGKRQLDPDSPDGPDSPPVVSACGGTPQAAVGQWRRLNALQYANTVRDLLGETPEALTITDTTTGPFKTNARSPVQESDVDTYATVAASVATKAVGNMKALLGGCDVTGVGGEDKCAAQFIKDFGGRAFRRPLLTEEVTALTDVYKSGKEENFATGIRMVVQAALQSPNFLYLVETGRADPSGLRKLSGYEVASRLSYLLTGSMPDAELFAAAGDGDLNTPQGIRSATENLLASPKFVGQVSEA